jgi:hypothetical protein
MNPSTIQDRADGAAFHIVHLVTTHDGRTRLTEMDPRQATEKLPYLYRSRASAVTVLRHPAGSEFAWREKASGPRLLVQLRGLCVLIVNGGAEPGVSYRPLAPGSVVLDEDTGRHVPRCKVFEDEDAIFMVVALAPAPVATP